MTTVNEIAVDRWFVDPRESLPQKGDFVTVSDHNIPWRVTFVLPSRGQVYLLSVDGNRFGVESTSRIKTIWRDPNTIAEIDWSAAYGEEFDEEEDVD